MTRASFIGQLYFNTAGHAAMAIAFVYVGSKIAPLRSKTVAYILSGIWFLFSGFTLFTGVMMKNGWAIWGSIWSFVVILVLAFFIYQNEIDIYLDRWHTRMLNIKRNQSMFAYQFFLGLYKSHPINFLKGFRYV